MKTLNYITLVVGILMINLMYAELKTFGMPSETETKEIPSEEIPSEETPSEETPSEETPSEETPSEETPVEEDVIPIAAEDNEVNDDQPIKFKEEYVVSLKLGSSIPFGTNLKNQFTSGTNFEADISTPFGFSGFKLFGHLSMLNLVADGQYSDNYTDYSVTNLGLKLKREVSMLDISIGTGLSMANGTAMYPPFGDYDMTTLFISGSVSYTLPLSGVMSKIAGGKLQDLNIAVSAGGIEIFGAPAEDGTSDIIDLGISISHPFFF